MVKVKNVFYYNKRFFLKRIGSLGKVTILLVCFKKGKSYMALCCINIKNSQSYLDEGVFCPLRPKMCFQFMK